MQSLTRESPKLQLPDHIDSKRELFINSIESHNFSIDYYDEKAIEVFDNSCKEFLPLLPWGYHWEKVKGKYGIYRLEYAIEEAVKLILYGPDEKGRINYNLLVNGNNFYSLSHTRNKFQKRLGAGDREYPFPINRDASGYKFSNKPYMPGHCVDHVDSIIPPTKVVELYGKNCNSSYNAANYIPEIQKGYWGLTMRNGLVAAQRKNNLGYAQLTEYADDCKATVSGAAIPESVYFYCLDGQYKPTMVSSIDWATNYNQQKKPSNITLTKHMESFSTNLTTAPKALLLNIKNPDKTWEQAVVDSRKLGHEIRKKRMASYNPDKDQLYAYGNSSSLEYQNSYSSISAALAASDQSKNKLTEQNLKKGIEFGLKLFNLDKKTNPIDKDRYNCVFDYNKKEKPGFSEEIVDAIKQLSCE